MRDVTFKSPVELCRWPDCPTVATGEVSVRTVWDYAWLDRYARSALPAGRFIYGPAAELFEDHRCWAHDGAAVGSSDLVLALCAAHESLWRLGCPPDGWVETMRERRWAGGVR